MAKKVRGTSSTYRPGGQGPARTSKTSGAAAVSGEELAASPETGIDAALGAVTQQTGELTISESAPPASSARRSRRGAKIKADSLVARAAAEDTYVREDLRSIGMITGLLVIGLIIAWVLFVPMNLAGLY